MSELSLFLIHTSPVAPLKPGCLVDHRQLAENLCVSYHETHTCVKRPNRAHTSIQHEMYILYKKGVCLQLYLITIYTKTGSSFQNLQNTKNKANLAISSPPRSQIRPIPGCTSST